MNLDLNQYDNGIVEILREIVVLIGTKDISELVLLERGYQIKPPHLNLALNMYIYGNETWSVCYQRNKCKNLKTCSNYKHGECTTYFNLMSIYRQERR